MRTTLLHAIALLAAGSAHAGPHPEIRSVRSVGPGQRTTTYDPAKDSGRAYTGQGDREKARRRRHAAKVAARRAAP